MQYNSWEYFLLTGPKKARWQAASTTDSLPPCFFKPEGKENARWNAKPARSIMILDRGQMVANAHTLFEGTQSVDFVIEKAYGDKQRVPDAIIHRWSTLSIFATE